MVLLPMITSRAQARFRGLPRSRRADAVQEAVVAALTNYQLLASRGQLHVAYPGTLADFALRHVNEGRHVGGRQDTAKDVLSPTAQDRHSLIVRRYDEQEPEPGADWQDLAIAERRRDSVAAIACFRIDFARWLKALSHRDRKIIRRLIQGDRAAEVAGRFGVSPARISQMRRRFQKHWARFQGEEEEPALAA